VVHLRSLIVALTVAHATVDAGAWAAQPATLAVPFLPQSEALCGGAAAAMVFRYWGDTHAGVEQFASLVDRRAGGIADGVLINAIAERGWRTQRIPGSIEALRHQIGEGRPVIILTEQRAPATPRQRVVSDRPALYHYVVVIGVDADAVIVHDPSWGPSRRIGVNDLIRAWRRSDFWALIVLPSESRSAPPPLVPAPASTAIRTACDVRLDEAIARIRERGFDDADAALGDVRAQCPDAAGPLRELAGVRFAQRRWRDAETLSAQAVALDAQDAYAWEVLASSRFVQDDLTGALDAWNRIGKPRVDLVNITGLQRARYELVAASLGLTPNTILTAEGFGRAARRLSELPDRTSARIAFRPADDGFATVDVVIAERELHPRGALAWGGATAKALVDRQVDVAVPGSTGQGELWSARWRWWSGRPRIALSFATPRVGLWPGVWRVDGSWESQRYVAGNARGAFSETRAHGGVSVTDWRSSSMRYGVSAGFDEWNGERRTASAGALLEKRSPDDRLSIAADAAAFTPLSSGPSFQSAAIRADARTSATAAGWVLSAGAGASAVTDAAPLALWPGAGEGHARPALLRAHPLLEEGAIAGPAFGRTLVHASAELQRWLERTSPIHVAIAGFVDTARATRRLAQTVGAATQADVGVGVRVKIPGSGGTLRADVGRGLRDGATAFTVGWQYW
jgi:hypothetical protein